MDTANTFPKSEKNHKSKIEKQRSLIYLLIFLFTLHFTPATYLESIFLEQLVGSEKVGLIFSIASVFTILTIAFTRKVIKVAGNYKVFLSSLIAEFVALSILSFSLFLEIDPFLSIFFAIAFMVGFVARSIAFFNFDIFTEHLSSDKETGSIRGTFLTALNFAFIIGPLISGMIVNNQSEIGKSFIFGILLLIPVIFITLKYFSKFKDAEYKDYEFLGTVFYIVKNNDLRNIFICNFLLFFFYSWMIIYTPVYLYETIGFHVDQVSTMIGIGLIPFLLLQYYLGKIADTKYGEKEILTIGFLIMGFATAFMTLAIPAIFFVWAIILFITRIGASMVESMVETYVFKKVNDKNLDVISLHRTVRPVAYIISPIVASIFLIFFDIQWIFVFLGIIMILGINFSLRIKDTL